MELNRDVARRAIVGLGILGLLSVVAVVVVAFIAPVVFAVFLYYAVRPIFEFLDRFGLPRSLRALLSLLLFGVPFLVLLAYTVAIIAVELEAFLTSRGILDSARQRIVDEMNIAELDVTQLETLLTETESLPSPDVLLDALVTATSAVGGRSRGRLRTLIVIVVTLYRRVFARCQFRAVKPPLLRCGAENTHNNHYQRRCSATSRPSSSPEPWRS
ncbi:hypothetical protein BRD19_10545 [Halobacteriales archaeon SW_7_65_23]|nr:MAG: hypothetical protein BRD19_10545 [Halobacteriales archaeon SW_7_65_23]